MCWKKCLKKLLRKKRKEPQPKNARKKVVSYQSSLTLNYACVSYILIDKKCWSGKVRNSPGMRIVVGVEAIMILVLIATSYAVVDAIATTMILSEWHSLHPMIIHVVIIVVAWYGTTGVHVVWTSLHLLRIHGCCMILIHILLLHKNYILFFIVVLQRKREVRWFVRKKFVLEVANIKLLTRKKESREKLLQL